MRALFLLIAFAIVSTLAFESDFSLLEDVKTFTFAKGKMTRGRRSAPVKQIDCVGGDACKFYEPEVINCRNLGKDDRGNIQWECKAELLDYYRLGRTDVGCEGYTSSEDPYILSGSCGVEYTLHLTEKGKQHHLKPKVHHHQPKKQYRYAPPPPRTHTHEKSSFGRFIDAMIALAVTCSIFVILGFLCCCCLVASREPRTTIHSRGPRGPVGLQPPPPVSAHVREEVHHHHHRTSDGPGFGTGFVMGRATAPRYQPTVVVQAPAPHPVVTRRAKSPSPDYSSSSSGWGSWGGGGGYSPSSSSSSSSPPKSYTSTGYGGTKKR